MNINVLFIILWMLISFSYAWTSSINSIFARSANANKFLTNKDLLESFANGMQMSLEHCQRAFKWDRWNCPESSFSIRGRQPSTKETAFVLAITSAGVVYSITRNCSRGELSNCGCDPKYENTDTNGMMIIEKNNTWRWGGCSEYLEYGEQTARSMLDSLERGNDAHTLVNLHNNAAGRMAIRSTMQKRCRCHGVSGSCSMKTCWLQMAPFHDVTNLLRKRYERAFKVDNVAKFNSVRNFDTTTSVSAEEFVYLLDSPNYCKPEAISGWNGTKGRICSRNKDETTTVPERKSCRNLCRTCGHRVKRERKRVAQRCNCTFHWCCEVKCDICVENVNQFFCA